MPLSVSVGVVDRSRTSDDPSTLTWCVVIGKPERSKLGSSPAKAPDAVAASPAVIVSSSSLFMERSPIVRGVLNEVMCSSAQSDSRADAHLERVVLAANGMELGLWWFGQP